MAFVNDDRHPAIERLARVPQAQKHQRRGHSPTLLPTVPDAARESTTRCHERRCIESRDLEQRLHHAWRAMAHARKVLEAAPTDPARTAGTHFDERDDDPLRRLSVARHRQNWRPSW